MKNTIDRGRLGARLREIREYAGYSQEEVASHLGISRSAVSLIETGSRRVDAIELSKLAKLYQWSTDSLLDQEDLVADPESVKMVARATAALGNSDRTEVLRFAEFLRQRSRGKNE